MRHLKEGKAKDRYGRCDAFHYLLPSLLSFLTLNDLTLTYLYIPIVAGRNQRDMTNPEGRTIPYRPNFGPENPWARC